MLLTTKERLKNVMPKFITKNGKKIPLHSFKLSETKTFDNGGDFEIHHVDTIEAKDFDHAEAEAIKLFKIKKSDVSEIGADLGENIVGYEFDVERFDGRTGNKITEKQADKLMEGEDGEEAVTHVTIGFELEKVD